MSLGNIHGDELRLAGLYAQGQNQLTNIFNAASLFSQGVSDNSGMSYLGSVRVFRREFKEYSKAEFREISNKPVIKDILSGMTKLNKEEIKDRIAEYLTVV